MTDLRAVPSNSPGARIVLLAIIIVSGAFLWTAVRWQLGDMLATLTSPNDENASDIARMALELAPGDPAASILKGKTGDVDSVVAYQRAVELAPSDFRLRTEFAQALEQSGRWADAEDQFVTAVRLAPSYASPHWHLGNFYLRQSREMDAMAELRAAAREQTVYRDQTLSLVWEYYGKDPARLDQIAGDDPKSNAELALFLAIRGQSDESLQAWNRLSERDKIRNDWIAINIAAGLYSQRRFPAALEFSRQLGFDADAGSESVTNGSFEAPLERDDRSRFGWKISRNDPRLDIAIDTRAAHEGSRSLRVSFKGYDKADFTNIVQMVAVRPGVAYKLSFWVKTENLRSMVMPGIFVVNGNDDRGIATSPSLTQGSTEWHEVIIHFTTPNNCNGIAVSSDRHACGDACPIAGTLWYDDFGLERE